MQNNPTEVLDKGFVRFVDTMGDDSSIVQAARVSYGEGTKSVSDDRNLIRYLMRHKHTTPFEMCEIKLHIKMPIFVARQWIRHRTANVNEYSGRYSIMPADFYVPEKEQVVHQDTNNKQGGDAPMDDVDVAWWQSRSYRHGQAAFEVYEKAVEDRGISREQSRVILPLSTYTEMYWKIDLHNLFHFLELRLDSHAQYEIRVYAEAIADFVKQWVPVAWEAFEDYKLNAVTFSAKEMDMISLMFDDFLFSDNSDSVFDAFKSRVSEREYKECLGKLDRVPDHLRGGILTGQAAT